MQSITNPTIGAAISFLTLKSISVKIQVKTPTATLNVIQTVENVRPRIRLVETLSVILEKERTR